MPTTATIAPTQQFMFEWRQRCNQSLEQSLDAIAVASPRLLQAMRYSLLGDGKRIRPILAYAGADAVATVSDAVDAVACAVECVHAYSLIHDDLPAMDDDELRRGRPTCHIAFDEATAILAGDALQTMAFDCILAAAMDADLKQSLLAVLVQASGARGMVAGQALDLAAADRSISIEELELLHRHKTGALIRAAVLMGAMATGKAGDEQLRALEVYADAIGLAFQVQDDILDVTGNTVALGKSRGSDQRLNKSTYVSLLGLAAAQDKAGALLAQAREALEPFGHRADRLRQLADYVVQRDR